MSRRLAESPHSLPLLSLLTTLSTFLCFAGLAGAQVTPGTPSFSAYDSHEVDTVNLMNNNILLTVPVMSKAGGFGFNYSLSTSSYMLVQGTKWQANMGTAPLGTTGAPFYGSVNGLIGPGGNIWSVFYTTISETTCNGYVQFIDSGWYTDGTPWHYFPLSDTSTVGNGTGCNSGFTDTTIDGSAITATIIGGSATSMYLRNGTSVNATTITDSNGNSITSTTYTSFTDSLGLTALTTSGSGSSLQYKWTDVNGGSPTLSQNTSPLILKSVFNCSGVNDYDGGTTTTALTSGFSFPDGTSLGFTYEITPGFSPKVTGRLNQITLREGGAIAYTYGGGTHNGLDCTYQNAPTLTRTLGNGDVTTYTLTHPQIGTSGNYQAVNTVIDPGGNKTIYTFTGFTSTGLAALPTTQLLTQVQRYQGSSTLLTTDIYCYNANISNCATAVASYPIKEIDVYHTIGGMSNSSRTQTKYDTYQNVTYSAQYDFGGTSPVRATTIKYGSCSAGCTGSSPTISSIGSNVNDKPGDVLTTQNGSTVAESRYTYDSHGNLLTAYAWNGSSWLSNPTANVYNSNGTISTAYDLAGTATTYAYNGTGGCNNLFPTSVTKGGLTTYATWNCTGGVKLTDKDASGNTTTYGYVNSSGTADPFWRVMSVTDPLTNKVWKTYPSGSSPTTVNSSFTFNSGNSIQNTTATVDGYGRTTNVQTQQSPSATNYDTASPSYGWSTNYRKVATSLPCTTTQGSTCGTVHTDYYDPLGRLYQGVTTSNETVTHTYTQNDDLMVLSPAPTNENNKQVQKEYDGLGRPTKSCAIGNGSSTPCGQNTGSASGLTTSFSYASATGSTTTTTTRGSQTRTNTYDALGRLTQKITPEGGTWTYYYDSYASCPTGYRGVNGKLAAVKDPNLTLLCYAYDSLNRVTGVNANGTTCRHFYYDSSLGYGGSIPSGVSTPTNSSGRMVEAATDTCASNTLITDEWFSYDTLGHTTDRWEKTPNSTQYYHSTATFYGNGVVNVLTMASPSLGAMTYGLDGEGRWSSMKLGSTTLVSATTFNAASLPTNIAIGTSTDYDSYTYDSNTSRMKGWTFQVGTGSSNQETAILNWNPIGTLKSLAITDGFNAGGTQTCYFNPSSGTGMGYDDWNRLLYDSCGTGGSIWNQTFSYDQYDNLCKSSTGFVSWCPTYANPNTTNHYTCTGCTYDSNGNVTNDGTNAYTWNEFSKMASINKSGTGCSTGGSCLIYDAFGNVVEIDSGATKTEIWYTQLGKTAFMNGTTKNYIRFPSPGGGTIAIPSTGGQYYMHKDWLGNARITSGISGQSIITDRAYAPYGEVYDIFDNTSTNYTMFGGDSTQDVTAGMYNTPNRELQGSQQGRWLSPDPAGAGWNQYAYTANPNSVIDPTGLGESDHCGRWCSNPPDAPFNPKSGSGDNPALGLFSSEITNFGIMGGLIWVEVYSPGVTGTVAADAGSSGYDALAGVFGGNGLTDSGFFADATGSNEPGCDPATCVDLTGTTQTPPGWTPNQDCGGKYDGCVTTSAPPDVETFANNAMDWVIRDFSLLRLKDEWKWWAVGYGTKISIIKLVKPAATTTEVLSGVGTLIMLGSTMIDATSPGMPLAPGPPPPPDPCMGQFMGLNWVPGPNGTTVGVPACQ